MAVDALRDFAGRPATKSLGSFVGKSATRSLSDFVGRSATKSARRAAARELRPTSGGGVSDFSEDVRISYRDLWVVWTVLDSAAEQGKGAIRREAGLKGISATRISRAIDRVEAALGGEQFFVMRERRSAALTPAGKRFLNKAPRLLKAWTDLDPTLQLRGPLVAVIGETNS